ncbi:MAG TPA: AAA family ATPase [Gammaproteobacteria bacterium]|nr:AAA family ATPase [Gammaproteobacteria bacterium]
MNVVAVLRSNEASDALSEACTDINGTKINIRVGQLEDIKAGVEIVQDPDVLVLDVDPQNDDEVEHLKRILDTHFPGIPVVVTAQNVTLQDIRQLMRMGIVDFLPQPITRNDLLSALNHAAEMRQTAEAPGGREGKVISFLKSGGGVGASTLAVQSTLKLAERGKGQERLVCLIDFNVQFGAAALYLDLDNRVNLADLLEQADRLDKELLRSVMLHHACGLDLLAAPRDMIGLEAISPEFVTDLIRIVCAEYDFVIVDLPEAWTPWSYRALELSDLVILVTQLTVAGVRQARRQLDTMQAHGLAELPVKVALNRFEKGWGRSVHLKEAEKALGRPFDYFVANDYKIVSEALNQGVPLGEIKRKSKVEQGVHAMMEAVVRSILSEESVREPRLSSGLRR